MIQVTGDRLQAYKKSAAEMIKNDGDCAFLFCSYCPIREELDRHNFMGNHKGFYAEYGYKDAKDYCKKFLAHYNKQKEIP